jgi:hypothetical protein
MSTELTPPAKTSSALLRVAMLGGALIGTLLWLSSFIPVVQHWGDKQANGFQLIPAF